MTKQEKSALIALFRLEITLQRSLSITRQEIGEYCHINNFNEEELLECEQIAQSKELD